MRYFDNYSEDNVVSKILYIYFAFSHGVFGLFLVVEDLSRFNSKVINAMDSVMPISIWGVMLILSALSFMLVAIQEGKIKGMSMIFAGFVGAMIYGLLAMASMELSVNQTNTLNYIFISSVDLLIATLGGITLWKLRT